ncbi:MAG TPA: hypothetical protein PL125_04570 [Candidatus Omnitrophota bacterium]|nr:hypothetical protein [Candidatus Omnitrophota bacterium]
MPSFDKKAAILFIVIGVVMVVALLSVAILRIVSNHSRLTHHSVSRIQAQYAAKSGVIYAMDKLRRNDDATCWPATGTYTRRMCRSCADSCAVIELTLPISIDYVDITVDEPGDGISGTRKISATATFTYDTP